MYIHVLCTKHRLERYMYTYQNIIGHTVEHDRLWWKMYHIFLMIATPTFSVYRYMYLSHTSTNLSTGGHFHHHITVWDAINLKTPGYNIMYFYIYVQQTLYTDNHSERTGKAHNTTERRHNSQEQLFFKERLASLDGIWTHDTPLSIWHSYQLNLPVGWVKSHTCIYMYINQGRATKASQSIICTCLYSSYVHLEMYM